MLTHAEPTVTYFFKNILMYSHLLPGVSADLCLQLFKVKQRLEDFRIYLHINKNQMASTYETVTMVHSEMNPTDSLTSNLPWGTLVSPLLGQFGQ